MRVRYSATWLLSLFLLGFLFGEILGSLFSLALVLFVDLALAKLSENSEVLLLLGDLLWGFSNLSGWLVEDMLVGVLLGSFGGLKLVGS